GATRREGRRGKGGPPRSLPGSCAADEFGEGAEVLPVDRPRVRLDLLQHPERRGVERRRHAAELTAADDLPGHGVDLARSAELEVPPGDRLDACEMRPD